MPKSSYTAAHERLKRMLVEAREAAGLTQVELAERIGWEQTNISKVERGERRLDVVEFLQFADALGFDPGEFVRALQAKKR